MSRYTPKRLPKAQGGGPARPSKSGAAKPGKAGKKTARPGAFKCGECAKAFNTEEALATHAADAHGKSIDVTAMSELKPGMVRCPQCGTALRKRNLERHLTLIHGA